ncbi:MAG: GTP-binding protein [Candidatus Saccharimonadales bacterium]|jgi:GTP-binding protein
MFVDIAKVVVKAGDGGGGIVSFRRDRTQSKGGPDGGDGGNGGDVVFVGSFNQNTLANFRFNKELKAADGSNGANSDRHGRSGKKLEVHVPVGTQVSMNGNVIADFTEDGQTETMATGGRGGFGNAHFTSSVRQAPKLAEKGDTGELIELDLELKIIADVGLVGLPNAGKSTLLASVSSARPKIANYPFTTLNPHLGVVRVDKGDELLIADIPGLIEGASDGKGLGDEFLRHVERTQVLLHMIDGYSDDMVRDYTTIQNELKNYKIDLSTKPQLLAITKVEGLDEDIIEDQVKTLKKAAKKTTIFPISSLSSKGMKPLLYELSKLVRQERKIAEETEEDDGLPVIRAVPDEDSWEIEQKKTFVVVRGKKIERFASRTDFGSEDGVRRLRDIMRKMSIMRTLEKRKIEHETKVYFGENREDYLEY